MQEFKAPGSGRTNKTWNLKTDRTPLVAPPFELPQRKEAGILYTNICLCYWWENPWESEFWTNKCQWVLVRKPFNIRNVIGFLTTNKAPTIRVKQLYNMFGGFSFLWALACNMLPWECAIRNPQSYPRPRLQDFRRWKKTHEDTGEQRVAWRKELNWGMGMGTSFWLPVNLLLFSMPEVSYKTHRGRVQARFIWQLPDGVRTNGVITEVPRFPQNVLYGVCCKMCVLKHDMARR